MCTVWLSHSKWLNKYRNKSAWNFALSLNIPLQKLFRWFRRPQLWATCDWQLHHHNTPTHASCLMQSFFWETLNHPGDSAPLQPRFGTLWLLDFPKTKITFEREEILDHPRFRKIRWCSWWQLAELCEVPRCLLWRGLRLHCPMYSVSCIFFNKCLYFSHYVASYLLERLYTHIYAYLLIF